MTMEESPKQESRGRYTEGTSSSESINEGSSNDHAATGSHDTAEGNEANLPEIANPSIPTGTGTRRPVDGTAAQLELNAITSTQRGNHHRMLGVMEILDDTFAIVAEDHDRISNLPRVVRRGRGLAVQEEAPAISQECPNQEDSKSTTSQEELSFVDNDRKTEGVDKS